MNVTREYLPDSVFARLVAGVTSRQDRACMLLALGGGLRLGELAALNIGSLVSLPCDEVESAPEIAGFVLVTPGRWAKRLPIGPSVLAALNYHLEMRNLSRGADPLFLSASGDRLTREQLSLILRKWCVRLGLEPLTYATLRATFAAHHEVGGLPLVAFKQLTKYMPYPSAVFRSETVRRVSSGDCSTTAKH